jgi:hypothetical protein
MRDIMQISLHLAGRFQLADTRNKTRLGGFVVLGARSRARSIIVLFACGFSFLVNAEQNRSLTGNPGGWRAFVAVESGCVAGSLTEDVQACIALGVAAIQCGNVSSDGFDNLCNDFVFHGFVIIDGPAYVPCAGEGTALLGFG